MSTQPSVQNTISAREILQGARELIADPAHFCKGALAMNGACVAVNVHADDACRWCASGALLKIGRDGPTAQAQQLLRAACSTLFGTPHESTVNDAEDGHARILTAFALAIELAS